MLNMKRSFIYARFIFISFVIAQCWCGAWSQQDKTDIGGNKGASQSNVSTVGTGSGSATATKPGGADGNEELLLGGNRRPLYRLVPSDVVEVSFTVAPEFNQILTVQPDGRVMLKDAGLIVAEGLNLEEFSDAVQKAYAGYLHDPQAAVALKEFQHPYFIVGGEVGKPGKYELRSDTTVAEAVQIAGGLTQQAKHSQVVLFRRVNDDFVETRLLDLKKMLKQSSLKEDTHLRPGDMVFVPQNTISKISRFLAKPSLSMYMNPTQF
jgi:polysaccharide export outer membrane protein